MFELIIAKATQIEDPFEQSFFLMVHLSYLHPFDNTNNQVTRVAMNIPFIKNNLSPVSFAGTTADMYNMVVDKDIKAGVIWAGVVASYPDLIYNWRRSTITPSPQPTGSTRRWRQALVEQY